MSDFIYSTSLSLRVKSIDTLVGNILELDSLTKSFGSSKVVDEINLSITRNRIFGLLGPNGAGKTSIIRMITSIIKPDSGEIRFDGSPLSRKYISEIGYMPEERGLYKKMKVKDHLIYLSRIRGYNRKEAQVQVEYWTSRLGINDWWNKRVEELSKGMQQKIQFIATVLHKPKLLILDEPFSGLDPINANLIKSEIFDLYNSGTSIIFSTHRMDQIEEFCHDIALINHGKLILSGNLKDIKNRYKKNLFNVEYSGGPPDLSSFEIIERRKQNIIVHAPEESTQRNLLHALGDSQGHIHSFNEVIPRLNEIFITTVNEIEHG